MIRQGWTNSETGRVGSPRVQFLNFEMLHNTIEKNAKKLILQLDVNEINEEKIDSLKDHLKTFKGDKPLVFNIYDSQKKIKLTLNSKKQKVKITQDLLNELDRQKWYYKLN